MLRFSLRSHLFPNLIDVVDARTGRVVTAGEQFHNIITSPPYLKQTTINNLPADVIELNFATPLTVQRAGAQGPEWLISPTECNHRLVQIEDSSAYHPGNIAVNFKGQNFHADLNTLRYELVRGGVDLLRACHPEPVVREVGLPPTLEYPIRSFVVGYAPQSTEAQQSVPRSFVTRSSLLRACLNFEEDGVTEPLARDAACWRFFGRDRSLSAMDWRLRVPVMVDGAATESAWVLGSGVRREERPLIEDIVVYFRYQTRPTSEQ